ncbi:PEP-CTERM sorting domain-containing protein [Aquabacterium sp.]|uniref:PEP-CTERM sorting domain-containing protein n=1 Tax=Aquabacterium sp. TaxID=1872578 RepID=UPI0035AF5649
MMNTPLASHRVGPWALWGALALFAPSWVCAGVTEPATPPNINCQLSPTAGTVCGLYMDFSGTASTSPAGQSFSHQPNWFYTSKLYADASKADSGGGSLALLNGTDFATFGALKSQLSATSTTSGWFSNAPNASAWSNSTLAFQDRLTFKLAGAPAGTMGTMTGHLLLSGSVDASSANYPFTTSSSSAVVNVLSAGVSANLHAYGDRAATGNMPSVLTFTLPVQFNTPNFTLLAVQLQTAVNTSALNQYGATWVAAANAKFFNSAEWGGIDGVFDAQGHALTDWSVSSASGFDYTRGYAAQAVPEPSAWLMLLAGLGLLGLARRRG